MSGGYQPYLAPDEAATKPANGAHAGIMPRWMVADATHASFATQQVSSHSDLYIPLATAGVAGAMSAAQYTKLASVQGPLSRLNYSAAADLLSGAALTGGVATDVTANQNFTATATGTYLFLIRAAVLVTATAVCEFAVRAVINSAGALIVVKAGGAALAANGWGIAGSGSFILGGGLPAGTNTVKLQVVPSVNATAYCRPASAPNNEWAELQVYELAP